MFIDADLRAMIVARFELVGTEETPGVPDTPPGWPRPARPRCANWSGPGPGSAKTSPPLDTNRHGMSARWGVRPRPAARLIVRRVRDAKVPILAVGWAAKASYRQLRRVRDQVANVLMACRIRPA